MRKALSFHVRAIFAAAAFLLNSCGNLPSSGGSTTVSSSSPQVALRTTSLNIGPLAGNAAAALLSLSTTVQVQWTAASTTSWIHLTETSGTTAALGSAVRFTYDANTGVARSGVITFESANFNGTFTVTQAPAGYVAVVPSLSSTLTTIPVFQTASLLPAAPTFSVDIAGNIYYLDSTYHTLYEWVAGDDATATFPFPGGVSVTTPVVVDQNRTVFFTTPSSATPTQIYSWPLGSAADNLISSALPQTYSATGLATDLHGNTYTYGNLSYLSNTAVFNLTNSSQPAGNAVVQIPYTDGSLSGPGGMVLDAGGQFYAFTTISPAWSVVKADPASGALSTLASGFYPQIPEIGSTAVVPAFSNQAIDSSGNLYFGVFTYNPANPGTYSDYLAQWSPATGSISIAAAGTTALFGVANSSGVQQVASDGLGNVYVENLSGGIQKFAPVFMDMSNIAEPPTSGADQLPPILPAATPLNAVSDSPWLTITSQANGVVGFSFTGAAAPRTGHITVLNRQIAVSQPGLSPAAAPLSFVPLTPCRVLNSHIAGFHDFAMTASACGIPANAQAFALNVTALPDSTLAFLTLWPQGAGQPVVSTLNSDGRAKSVAAIVSAGAGGGVSLYASDAAQISLDVTGYFIPAGSTGLAFYPLSPCRLADTRQSGASYLKGGQTRSFAVRAGPCSVPPTAQAYSLNLTALPHQVLTNLTAWPAGKPMPSLSTLTAPNASVTANAAIIAAGLAGNINLYASQDADLVMDINGYFAPPGNGGLSLYAVSPCRVLDTRQSLLAAQVTGFRHVNTLENSCSVPANAQALVVNATALPASQLDYLTLWSDKESQPWVSTLNADSGVATSNMAIVPIKRSALNVYASQPTHLLLDISSYFAP